MNDTDLGEKRVKCYRIVAVALLLIALYVLSPGPVFALMNRYESGFPWLMRVDSCYRPVYWLVTRSETTRSAYNSWCQWWGEMLDKSP